MFAQQRIRPCLWFDGNAEEAVRHYVSIFKNSRILDITRFTEAGPGPEGSVLTVTFLLEGQEFMALNGGPEYKFTEAISLLVACDSQEEIDEYWSKLGAGGQEIQCGWLKDKFGLSWQVAPRVLGEMLTDADPKKADRAMRAMMEMVKIDIGALKRAYDNL